MIADYVDLRDRLVEYLRAEIESLEHSVEVYRGLHAKYERELEDARERLAWIERKQTERERS
ncbi:hypothetical protein [uncultured Paenibacillus sp.]|uniref:hypothetical protein n=1 Tax=uncultured Paenibacillus sp. TaxID=227322 RepID=UPI0015AC034B|nr:hypothetical protein [uncultured Paenibacillus sp.]